MSEALEPKHKAYRRLKADGRLEDFRRRKREIRHSRKCFFTRMSHTEAFYEALKEFPPLADGAVPQPGYSPFIV